MSGSKSSELGVESHLGYRFEDWAFSFSTRLPSSLSCINEYLAIDRGGNVDEYSSCEIAAWIECFPEKSSWCRDEQVCHVKLSVKRFERSNGRTTALMGIIGSILFMQMVA